MAFDEEQFQQVLNGLEGWANRAMNRSRLAGMALGVVKDGKLVYAGGFGSANLAEGKPVTPHTVFGVASISKSFTAIGLMQLWEQGRFDLDDPINPYLKAYQVRHPDPQAPPVTFRHLLTHTAGIGETKDLWELIETFYLKGNPYSRRAGEPVISLREYTGGTLRPDAYPDQKWAYANLGYATIGQLIEDLSGQPFASYMVEHVFEPLGMHHSDYVYSQRVGAALAQGYEYARGRMNPVEMLFLPRQGARSVLTSLEDMALYAAALMNMGANDHGAVLQPATLEKMFTPHYHMDERFLFSMGLGFYINHLGGHRVVGHDGNIPGFCGNLLVAPEEKLGLILLINTSFTENNNLALDLMGRLLGAPDITRRLPHPGVLESPHLWGELCGLYGPSGGFLSNYRKYLVAGGEVEVFVKNNRLMMRSMVGMLRRSMPLFAADPNDPLFFETTMGHVLSQAVFVRNAQGVVDRFHSAGGEFLTFYKRPYLKSQKFKVHLGLAALAGVALSEAARLLQRKKRGSSASRRGC